MDKWDKRFLDLARHVATWSKDPTTKVGAVIVDSKNRVVSLGYNGFPRGVDDSEERYNDRDMKRLFVCHAERNALDNAPGPVEGCTLYCTHCPCNECAKSVIQNGIVKVVTISPEDTLDKFWSWNITQDMFRESGVDIRYFSD